MPCGYTQGSLFSRQTGVGADDHIGPRTANGRPYSANPSAPCFRQTSPRRAEGGLWGKRGFHPKDRTGGALIVPQNDLRSVTVGSSHSSRPNKQKSRPLRNGFLVWSCPADSNCRLSVACGNQQPLRSNTRFARRSAVLVPFSYKNKKPHPKMWFNGAVEQIRTADLVITNDVLCLLSYNSIWRP